MNSFSKKYTYQETVEEQLEEVEEEPVQQDENLMFASEEQIETQIIHVADTQYQQFSNPGTSTVIVNNHAYP